MKLLHFPPIAGGLLVTIFACFDCQAHGFGEQLELEIPLWLWLGGAGLTVVLSFAVVIDFLPRHFQSLDYPEIDITNNPVVRILTSNYSLWSMRVAVLLMLALVISAGVFGTQSAPDNIAPTAIWIMFWVGVSFTSVLIGNFWRVINPLSSIYYLLFRHSKVNSLQDSEPPAWATVFLFAAFMYAEHLWPSADVPRSIALLALAYIIFCLGAMHKFGPANWLSNAEIFSMTFSIFGRFSAVRFSLSDDNKVKVYLRPPAIGLLGTLPSKSNLSLLIIMLLAGVTFDGWIETQTWDRFLFRQAITFSDFFGIELATHLINLLGMLLFPISFLSLFYLTCLITKKLLVSDSFTSWQLVRHYATSLMPIAIAYHFAHYATSFLIDGQAFFSLLSDPFGWGWNLFGTAQMSINDTQFSARSLWYFVVFMIVVGHMLSVYLAHLVTLTISGSKSVAVRAGTPILLLMVIYTVLSLWVIAQPTVQG